jgi:hypothetical protein
MLTLLMFLTVLSSFLRIFVNFSIGNPGGGPCYCWHPSRLWRPYDVFDAPAFNGILVIDSDIAVASVIFAVASFHLLASLMWIASLQLLIFLLLLVSLLLLAFLLRLSGILAIDVSVHVVG